MRPASTTRPTTDAGLHDRRLRKLAAEEPIVLRCKLGQPDRWPAGSRSSNGQRLVSCGHWFSQWSALFRPDLFQYALKDQAGHDG